MRQPLGFSAKEETTPVFVRVPAGEAEKLDRAAFELKRPKREIVSVLLSALQVVDGELVLGRAALGAAPAASTPAEVLTPGQAAELLQVHEALVLELAGRGELPARRVGEEWRFSRSALLDWLRGG